MSKKAAPKKTSILLPFENFIPFFRIRRLG